MFDDTLLFDIDKFSGYDRFETGTRANFGMQYTFQANNGLYARAVFGQSYHLAGENAFADPGFDPARTCRQPERQLLPAKRPRDQIVPTMWPASICRRFAASVWSRRAASMKGTGRSAARIRILQATLWSALASIGYTFSRFDPTTGVFDKQQESALYTWSASDRQLERRGPCMRYDIDAQNGSRTSSSSNIPTSASCSRRATRRRSSRTCRST